MKLHYYFVFLLSLGFFLPAHGMNWLFGSEKKTQGIQVETKDIRAEEEENKRVEAKKNELQKSIEELKSVLQSKRLVEVIESTDIGDPITFMFDLIEKNPSKMGKKLDAEIEKKVENIKNGFLSGFASLATKNISVGKLMTTIMLAQRKGVRSAFRDANGEFANKDPKKAKKDHINVFDELSKEDQDLVKPVTLCIFMKIGFCLEENKDNLIEVFTKKATWPITLSIPHIINAAVKDSVKKDSDWHDTFVAMAQNSLSPDEVEDDEE